MGDPIGKAIELLIASWFVFGVETEDEFNRVIGVLRAVCRKFGVQRIAHIRVKDRPLAFLLIKRLAEEHREEGFIGAAELLAEKMEQGEDILQRRKDDGEENDIHREADGEPGSGEGTGDPE